MMKKRLSLVMTVAILLTACSGMVSAQTPFAYKGVSMQSSATKLYVNPATKTKEKLFTFATVNEALRFVEQKTGVAVWTDIYIEPSVYWIDNPDDKAIRKPEEAGGTPYGMKVKVDRVRLIGLSDTPEDVVLACNRGQTQGADGNFTMFHFTGSDIEAENITFGNYCNVDLVYPRNPQLNRQKRKDAIVQAQLVICNGDNYHLRNCRFISRLNLCPFVGAQHATFDNCYFECTDDALCGTGEYRKCRFTFFSSKPFYTTSEQGAKFIDCDIHTKTQGTQYLCKVSGPVTMENCRWTSDDPNLRIEWAKRADPRHNYAMTDCTLNGAPLDVPQPTEPLVELLPPVEIKMQRGIIPGRWTIDCYKPTDTDSYSWVADNTRPSWGFTEGEDGAEGSFGMVPLQKGARLMYTPKDEYAEVTKQSVTVELDPCKSAGQGFGSATGQYLDICIKFDTRRLSGYGIRFVRIPDYDHAVEAYLMEYSDGNVFRLGDRKKCEIFKRGCCVTLKADGPHLTAEVTNGSEKQSFSAEIDSPNTFGGFHLQHTGSVGPSAVVVKSIKMK